MIARSLWLVICVTATLTFLFALPARYVQLLSPEDEIREGLARLGYSSEYIEQYGTEAAMRTVLSQFSLPSESYAVYQLTLEVVVTLVYVTVALVIFWRKSDSPIGLFASLFLVTFGIGGSSYVLLPFQVQHSAGFFLTALVTTLAYSMLPLFFYLFPDGRFVPRWAWIPAGFWAVTTFFWNFTPRSPLNPTNWTLWLFFLYLVFIWGSSAFAQIYRYRRVSSLAQRQQTKWLVFGFGLTVLLLLPPAIIAASLGPGTESEALYSILIPMQTLAMSTIPVALAISILRYRLWDIDFLINRALVYGTLTVFVVAAYVIVVGGLGALLHTSGNFFISLLVTGVIALLFNPLRQRLQRFVNRFFYGERDDPYAVLSRLGQNLESTLAPDSILPAIVETIAHTLKLPYCAITYGDADSAKAAVFGSPSSSVIRLPLSYHGQLVGELHVAQRAPDESFADTELRLLEDIAAQTGVAVHNVRLTADLQRSREQLVSTREEERRRLRRDLYDGLGPKLAGQVLILEAIRDSLRAQPESRALVEHLIADSQTVVSEVRQLVHGLRPPALDEYGLVGAVRAYAAQCEAGGLRVRVSAPGTVSPLPAAVEVAAYRIAQESLTNVVRHSQAKNCVVTLTMMDRNLKLEISDDGVGLPPQRKPGVGLASMRERAEEIGGRCVVENGEHGGARVTAQLPVSHHG